MSTNPEKVVKSGGISEIQKTDSREPEFVLKLDLPLEIPNEKSIYLKSPHDFNLLV